MSDLTDDTEVLRTLWKVTERRDGAIFRTEFVRLVWVPWSWRTTGTVPECPDLVLASPSTSTPGPWIRRNPQPDEAPGCPSCYLATGETVAQRWDPDEQEWRCPLH